jgi:hypothetical protein
MADTGEKARALQHWSDLGILRAEADTDKKGRGRYREYAVEPYFGERRWALVAAELNKFRIPLGEMRSIIDILRKCGEPDFSLPNQSEREAINRFQISPFFKAIAGDGEALILIGKSVRDGRHCIGLCWLPSISEDMLRPRDVIVLESPELLFMRMLTDFMREHAGAHCLNLSKIFEPLRRSESLPEKVKATRP